MLQMIKYAAYSQLFSLRRFECHARKKSCRYQGKQMVQCLLFHSVKCSLKVSELLITKHVTKCKSYNLSKLINYLFLFGPSTKLFTIHH